MTDEIMKEFERKRTADKVASDRFPTPTICSICGDKYYGWGNNAWPINPGRCCNACDETVVIPQRIEMRGYFTPGVKG